MYHVIADPPAGAAYPQLFVGEADFGAQMRWLARHGYRAVTLRDVWDHWHRGATLPPKPVVISFDDGYRSVTQAALPHLQARSWPGVLNLTVKNLRVSGGLSEFKVRSLLAAGWELASHTLTHPDLPSLDDRGSRARSRARKPSCERASASRWTSSPTPQVGTTRASSARCDVPATSAATTTVEGLARPGEPYELRRVRVSGGDGVAGLAAKLVRSSTS